ncbi:MAG: hypothetical protein CL908_14190 [Deltaproteobacteria bacterium]|nr:hypothetical protein [Deltaproteobacteria bacterium]
MDLSPAQRPRWTLRVLGSCLILLQALCAARVHAETVEVCVDQDTWLKESSPNEKHPSDCELSTKTDSGDRMRTLLEFDLSSLPSNVTVTSAVASLWVSGKDDPGDPVTVHRVTKNWAENGARWKNAAEDFDSTVEASFAPTQEDRFYTFDIASLVEKWLDGTHQNHGVMLIATSSGTEAKFASREWDTPSQRPCMGVTYGIPVVAGVDHFRIGHDKAGSYCLDETIQVEAMDSFAEVEAGYTGTIALDTQSGTGSWSLVSGAGASSDSTADDGQASYSYSTSDSGIATFALTYTNGPQTFNVDASDGPYRDDDSEGDLTFSPSAFTLTASGGD